jgi:hypothetical protein
MQNMETVRFMRSGDGLTLFGWEKGAVLPANIVLPVETDQLQTVSWAGVSNVLDFLSFAEMVGERELHRSSKIRLIWRWDFAEKGEPRKIALVPFFGYLKGVDFVGQTTFDTRDLDRCEQQQLLLFSSVEEGEPEGLFVSNFRCSHPESDVGDTKVVPSLYVYRKKALQGPIKISIPTRVGLNPFLKLPAGDYSLGHSAQLNDGSILVVSKNLWAAAWRGGKWRGSARRIAEADATSVRIQAKSDGPSLYFVRAMVSGKSGLFRCDGQDNSTWSEPNLVTEVAGRIELRRIVTNEGVDSLLYVNDHNQATILNTETKESITLRYDGDNSEETQFIDADVAGENLYVAWQVGTNGFLLTKGPLAGK